MKQFHGMTQSREYCSYHAAKSRCENMANPSFGNYGGRGIKFLLPSFLEFLSALGPRPEGTSLGRIDNDGHYEIGNVRWETDTQQVQNKRHKRVGRSANVVVPEHIRRHALHVRWHTRRGITNPDCEFCHKEAA